MGIYTRSNMNSIKYDLKEYCYKWNIDMGIDESDDRPYVVRYVFQREGYGCAVEIDFTQIVDIHEVVESIKEEINKHIIGRLDGKKSEESKVTANKLTCVGCKQFYRAQYCSNPFYCKRNPYMEQPNSYPDLYNRDGFRKGLNQD